MRFSKYLALACAVLPCLAQQPSTRAEEIIKQREETYRSPFVPDEDRVERGIVWARNHELLDVLSTGWHGFLPTFGGMINGAGVALGLQYLQKGLGNGRFQLRSSARISTTASQAYDVELGAPDLFRGHAYADLYARHRNYAQVDYYGPGPRSRKAGGTAYRLEDTSYDFQTGLKPAPWLRLGITGGYLKTNVGRSTSDDFPSTETVYSPIQTPGLDRQTDYLRGGAILQIDYRDERAGSARRGGNYYTRLDYYNDRDLKQYSFRRITAEAQQYFPFFNEKRVIALRAKTTLSYENPGNRVPFYLQPSLGSADDLRGFRPFRFYDNNNFIITGEYRWEISTGVEGALFADGGKVFPRPGLLSFSNLEGSFGAGLRFRAGPRSPVAARLDVGVSREGVQIWLVFNGIFASPQVRAGSEVTPPSGRLP